MEIVRLSVGLFIFIIFNLLALWKTVITMDRRSFWYQMCVDDYNKYKNIYIRIALVSPFSFDCLSSLSKEFQYGATWSLSEPEYIRIRGLSMPAFHTSALDFLWSTYYWLQRLSQWGILRDGGKVCWLRY